MTSDGSIPTKNVYQRVGHIGVAAKDFMIIWGGYKEEVDMYMSERYLKPTSINVFHSEFHYWTQYKTQGDIPLGTSGAAAYLVDSKMYVFAGHTENGSTNDLYYLDLKDLKHLTWTCLTPNVAWSNHWPSPRDKFASWVYNHKLYCFGGFGPDISDYLYENGSFVYDDNNVGPGRLSRGWNNQLLVYDTQTNTWTNPAFKGTPPLPRAAHAAVRSKDQVFIFGGRHGDHRLNDLHCLDLETCTWSGELYIEGACPCPRSWHTFTAVTDELAFLYGGFSNDRIPLSDAWQFNMRVRQWSQITVSTENPRLWHTCCRVDDGELLVFGGCENDILDWNIAHKHSGEVLSFRLQPPRLQRLCLEAVHTYKDYTYQDWTILPKVLNDWLMQKDTVIKVKQSNTAGDMTQSLGACTLS